MQEQQAIVAAMSSRVNEALHRLSSPLRRAEYILALEGHAGEETDKLEDTELLMEVMEAREALSNAQSAEDVADSLEQHACLRHGRLAVEDGASLTKGFDCCGFSLSTVSSCCAVAPGSCVAGDIIGVLRTY